MMRPETEADLAECVASLDAPVRIVGGGTRGIGGPGDVLDVSGLSGVELYEPGALTLVARAGTPVAEIERVLDSEGQRLAFEPMDHRVLMGTSGAPTIGGVAAANVSGPRRIQSGACRDFMLGVRYVDGLGSVVKNGGRVMKNVTGYDLVKLMAGAHGTLGVLSEVSLKVLPKPEAMATVLVQDVDLVTAVAAMSAALGSPYDLTGAGYDPVQRQVMLRLEGFAESVAYRAARLETELGQFGQVGILQDCAQMWQAMRDVTAFQDRAAVWHASIKPGDAPELLDCLDQMHGYDALLDWGGGRIWLAMNGAQLRDAATYGAGGRREDQLEGLAVFDANLRHNVAQLGGHVTLVKSPEGSMLPRFDAEPAPLAAISKGLRQKFDPKGFFNPGLMG